MRLTYLDVLGADVAHVVRSLALRQELGDNANGSAGIEHVDGLSLLVVGADLDGGVHTARRRATNEQRYFETFALHLGGNKTHLVE